MSCPAAGSKSCLQDNPRRGKDRKRGFVRDCHEKREPFLLVAISHFWSVNRESCAQTFYHLHVVCYSESRWLQQLRSSPDGRRLSVSDVCGPAVRPRHLGDGRCGCPFQMCVDQRCLSVISVTAGGCPFQMCVDQRCVSVISVTAGGCPGGCHGRGVCNSRRHCHCDPGWAPPNCTRRGVGGSLDSGPDLQREGKTCLFRM